MQNAETVLGVLRERGRRGLPVNELYRQLFNPQLYLLAYGRIYANHGAMTPGVTQETVDGMSAQKIGRVIDAMRHERYRFSPVRRVHIPKKNGKTRPLGLPTWSDKLVGEVVRLLLEAYYEPTFSDRSHGFRPGRGCHTALREIAHTWTGTAWFVEADIADCFGSLDHEIMIRILSEKIHDNRFLRLVRNMLTAGYPEDWKWGATLSGAPQGGVTSPILSSIYLHKLDEYVEKVLIPEYTRGGRRARNPAYLELQNELAKARRRGDRATARVLRRRMVSLPSADPDDPGYRRLRYCRYADDHLLGFTGPKAEAEEIKQRLAKFLREELKLELSHTKTLITHARTRAARFLGYEITVQHNDRKTTRRRRAVNGQVSLRVPLDVIKAKCVPYLRRGKPAKQTALPRGLDVLLRQGASEDQLHCLSPPPWYRGWPRRRVGIAPTARHARSVGVTLREEKAVAGAHHFRHQRAPPATPDEEEPADMPETFGELVRRLRAEKGLSLRELARQAHLNHGHLSRIENGRRTPSPEIAATLDRALEAGGELHRFATARPVNADVWSTRSTRPMWASTGTIVPDDPYLREVAIPVDRREFLLSTAAAVASSGLPSPRHVDPALIDYFSEQLEGHCRADMMLGPHDLIATVSA